MRQLGLDPHRKEIVYLEEFLSHVKPKLSFRMFDNNNNNKSQSSSQDSRISSSNTNNSNNKNNRSKNSRDYYVTVIIGVVPI